MKIFITTRFSTAAESKQNVEQLCAAVRQAGAEDFCFVRDVEHYQHVFDDPKELWQRAKDELAKCNTLLIDVSDGPTGGRVVEVGMAFASNQPIFVVAKRGTQYKQFFDGIAHAVIFYDTYDDIIAELRQAINSITK